MACSGGLDSMALLHATVAAAAPLGIRVVALHVDHGLHVDADAWRAHVAAACARWARRGSPISFQVRRLAARPPSGASVEAWARDERYAALQEMARDAGITLVLLAQHQRDQAETFLLQALRGAGVGGLAAMPRRRESAGVVWARPWLERPREAIESYARRHRLAHVDDPSNDDPRYARSRLRRAIWPVLLSAFPDAEASLAAASRAAGDAKVVVDDVARSDLEALCANGDAIDVDAWRRLPAERGRLLLVAWLRQRLGRTAPRSLVERLSVELHRPHAARWPVPGGELGKRRGRLAFRPAAATAAEPGRRRR